MHLLLHRKQLDLETQHAYQAIISTKVQFSVYTITIHIWCWPNKNHLMAFMWQLHIFRMFTHSIFSMSFKWKLTASRFGIELRPLCPCHGRGKWNGEKSMDAAEACWAHWLDSPAPWALIWVSKLYLQLAHQHI